MDWEAPQRGGVYPVSGQAETAVGLLVVSNNTNNKVRGEVTGVPVLREPPPRLPTVAIEKVHVAFTALRRLPTAELTGGMTLPTPEHLEPVWENLADALLLPELLSESPHWPPDGPAGDYPRWGKIYYAEPPLGGQTKRWLVVSHDVHNHATARALCVRTTSNTSLQSFETPPIQRGLALAVCPDVIMKPHERFDLESPESLEQLEREEMVVVARALTNFLLLHPQTGVFD